MDETGRETLLTCQHNKETLSERGHYEIESRLTDASQALLLIGQFLSRLAIIATTYLYHVRDETINDQKNAAEHD